jgi:hypothetical protein
VSIGCFHLLFLIFNYKEQNSFGVSVRKKEGHAATVPCDGIPSPGQSFFHHGDGESEGSGDIDGEGDGSHHGVGEGSMNAVSA